MGGRKVALFWRRRLGIPASFAIVCVLATLPLSMRGAAAADQGAFGDRKAAILKALHRNSGDRTPRQRPDEARSPAHTHVAGASFDTPSLGPLAFVQFCLRYPHECTVGEANKEAVILTQARIGDLREVNRVVNHSIAPRPTTSISQGEWHIAPTQGDCSDYAVTKRHELLTRGWPAGALLLAEVVLASGEHHLVLLVRMREADLILDNLNSDIRPASQSGYRWVRMQRADNPYYWLAVSMASAGPKTASAR